MSTRLSLLDMHALSQRPSVKHQQGSLAGEKQTPANEADVSIHASLGPIKGNEIRYQD